jgi:hypothetical protein
VRASKGPLAPGPVLGLPQAHERQSAAEFFDDFPCEGPTLRGEALTPEEFFGSFCDGLEPSAPLWCAGFQRAGLRHVVGDGLEPLAPSGAPRRGAGDG